MSEKLCCFFEFNLRERLRYFLIEFFGSFIFSHLQYFDTFFPADSAGAIDQKESNSFPLHRFKYAGLFLIVGSFSSKAHIVLHGYGQIIGHLTHLHVSRICLILIGGNVIEGKAVFQLTDRVFLGASTGDKL